MIANKSHQTPFAHGSRLGRITRMLFVVCLLILPAVGFAQHDRTETLKVDGQQPSNETKAAEEKKAADEKKADDEKRAADAKRLAEEKETAKKKVAVATEDVAVSSDKSVYRLNDEVILGLYGDFGKTVYQRATGTPAAAEGAVALYLDGVKMQGLTPDFRQPATFSGQPAPEIVVAFVLERKPNDENNRKSWDALLGRVGFDVQKLQIGVSLDNGLPHLSKKEALPFQVNDAWFIRAVIIVGVILFLACMWLSIETGMVRDGGPGTAFSLGKTQMAFWGFIVLFAFLGAWIVSHTMERIPSQVFVLLGISAGTGLGSIAISTGKQAGAKNDAMAMEDDMATSKSKQAGLLQEMTTLQTSVAAGIATSVEQARLAAVNQELFDLTTKLRKQRDELAKLNAASAHSTTFGSWYKDIVSDENGLSFHRLQVVLWTLILGVIFAYNVATVFTMPEFDQTLLVLMGISNGTYLGFKIPEKTS